VATIESKQVQEIQLTKIHNLEDRCASTKEELVDAKQRSGILEQRLDESARLLRDTEKHMADETKKVATMRTQLEGAQDRVKDMQVSLQTAKSNLEVAQNRITRAETSNADMQKAVTELRDANHSKEKLVFESEFKNKNLRKQLNETEGENLKLKTNLNDTNQQLKTLTFSLHETKTTNATLSEQIISLTARAEGLVAVHEKETEKLQNSFNQQLDDQAKAMSIDYEQKLEEEINERQRLISGRDEKIRVAVQKQKETESALKMLEKNVQFLNATHEKQLLDLDCKHKQDLCEQRTQLVAKFDNDMKAATKLAKETSERIKKENELSMQTLVGKHENQLTMLQDQAQTAATEAQKTLDSVREETVKATEAAQQAHVTELTNLETHLNESYDARIAQINNQHQTNILNIRADLKERHAQEMTKIVCTHDEQMKDLWEKLRNAETQTEQTQNQLETERQEHNVELQKKQKLFNDARIVAEQAAQEVAKQQTLKEAKIRQEHQETMRVKEQQHEATTASIASHHAEIVAKLEANIAKEKQNREIDASNHREQLIACKAAHVKAIQVLTNEKDSEIQRLQCKIVEMTKKTHDLNSLLQNMATAFEMQKRKVEKQQVLHQEAVAAHKRGVHLANKAVVSQTERMLNEVRAKHLAEIKRIKEVANVQTQKSHEQAKAAGVGSEEIQKQMSGMKIAHQKELEDFEKQIKSQEETITLRLAMQHKQDLAQKLAEKQKDAEAELQRCILESENTAERRLNAQSEQLNAQFSKRVSVFQGKTQQYMAIIKQLRDTSETKMQKAAASHQEHVAKLEAKIRMMEKDSKQPTAIQCDVSTAKKWSKEVGCYLFTDE
jgi:hypothetical protein